MKKRFALILFVFLSFCSCAENTEQSTVANQANPSGQSALEEPSNVQVLEPYTDVCGSNETETETLAPAFIDSVLQTSGEETDDATYYGTDPWLNDPDNPESEKWRHSFMTKPFFENGYNIRLAWNNPPSLYETTRQIIAEQEYTVSFIEETKEYADDPQVLEAILLCILERKQEEADVDGGLPEEVFLLTEPVVVDVDGPYEDADLQQGLES